MALLDVFHPEIVRRVRFLFYRHRFLLVYIVFGVLSLVLEAVLFRGIERGGVMSGGPAYAVGLAAGIYFAYWTNVRFNFKVPVAKRTRALFYFCVISGGSGLLNYLVVQLGPFQDLELSLIQARFASSGLIFFVAYLFHRKFSFADYKKVGVAIYANGIEDIKGIKEKIGAFPDFIHVDVIDSTFGEHENDPKAYRMEVIQAYWPSKPVHIHVMSKRPSKWIKEVSQYVDTIYVHTEIDEDVADTIKLIHDEGKRAGLCITMATDVEDLKPHISEVQAVMFLAVSSVGHSGQSFDMGALDRITEINRWPERSRFELCVDGGVNERNISLLNVERVVSGSSVLNAESPAMQIMRLQTSGNYEKL